MEANKINPAQNIINSLNKIFTDLTEKTGEKFPKIEWCRPSAREQEIYTEIEYDFQERLNFERCSESFFTRLFCHLAHGDDSCGSKEFVLIKRANQQVNNMITDLFYNWGLRKYIIDGYVWQTFEINRKHIRKTVHIRFSFPITIFSEHFQEIYNRCQSEHNDINWELVEKVLEEEFYGN